MRERGSCTARDIIICFGPRRAQQRAPHSTGAQAAVGAVTRSKQACSWPRRPGVAAQLGKDCDHGYQSHFLAQRRFPSTCFIRRRDQLDYLQEPDVFHDIYGHVPMLMNPVFADYMQAYGEGGLKALRLGHLDRLARLYWYTVEFGLIATPRGRRIYGSGILSSAGESVYCLEDPHPRRLRFDLRRLMRTRYHIDRYQETYFVIDSFEQLFDATGPDFAPIYREIAPLPDIEPDAMMPGDIECGSDPVPASKKEGPRVSTARV